MDVTFVLSKKVLDENYEFKERIGEPGQFGVAKKCVDNNSGNVYAAKVIDKHKFPTASSKEAFFDILRNEVKIMKELDHENVIKYFDFKEDEKNLYIIMELCQGGELFDRISEKGSYCEKDAAYVLRQIMEGLKYLHEQKIAHLDLKPDNFLFLDKTEDSVLKIIDFGMSQMLEKNKYLSRLVGTPYYIAPEVLKGQYTESCDVWSVGVILFVLLFGYPPFYADANDKDCDEKIFNEIRKGFNPEVRKNYGPWFPESIKCSESAKDCITKLLTYDPAERITAEEALEHPWLRGETADTREIDKLVLKRLMEFKNSYKLKEGFLKYVCNNMSSQELLNLKREFKKVDADGDGEISVAELQMVCKRVCSTVDEKLAKDIMNQIDINSDGKISYEEWCLAAISKRLVQKEERMRKLFKEVDTNKDGKLSLAEMKSAMTDFDIKDLEKAISEADLDGDGEIDYKEFENMFLH